MSAMHVHSMDAVPAPDRVAGDVPPHAAEARGSSRGMQASSPPASNNMLTHPQIDFHHLAYAVGSRAHACKPNQRASSYCLSPAQAVCTLLLLAAVSLTVVPSTVSAVQVHPAVQPSSTAQSSAAHRSWARRLAQASSSSSISSSNSSSSSSSSTSGGQTANLPTSTNLPTAMTSGAATDLPAGQAQHTSSNSTSVLTAANATSAADATLPQPNITDPVTAATPPGVASPPPPRPPPPFWLVAQGRPVWPWVVGLAVVGLMAGTGTLIYFTRTDAFYRSTEWITNSIGLGNRGSTNGNQRRRERRARGHRRRRHRGLVTPVPFYTLTISLLDPKDPFNSRGPLNFQGDNKRPVPSSASSSSLGEMNGPRSEGSSTSGTSGKGKEKCEDVCWLLQRHVPPPKPDHETAVTAAAGAGQSDNATAVAVSDTQLIPPVAAVRTDSRHQLGSGQSATPDAAQAPVSASSTCEDERTTAGSHRSGPCDRLSAHGGYVNGPGMVVVVVEGECRLVVGAGAGARDGTDGSTGGSAPGVVPEAGGLASAAHIQQATEPAMAVGGVGAHEQQGPASSPLHADNGGSSSTLSAGLGAAAPVPSRPFAAHHPLTSQPPAPASAGPSGIHVASSSGGPPAAAEAGGGVEGGMERTTITTPPCSTSASAPAGAVTASSAGQSGEVAGVPPSSSIMQEGPSAPAAQPEVVGAVEAVDAVEVVEVVEWLPGVDALVLGPDDELICLGVQWDRAQEEAERAAVLAAVEAADREAEEHRQHQAHHTALPLTEGGAAQGAAASAQPLPTRLSGGSGAHQELHESSGGLQLPAAARQRAQQQAAAQEAARGLGPGRLGHWVLVE